MLCRKRRCRNLPAVRKPDNASHNIFRINRGKARAVQFDSLHDAAACARQDDAHCRRGADLHAGFITAEQRQRAEVLHRLGKCDAFIRGETEIQHRRMVAPVVRRTERDRNQLHAVPVRGRDQAAPGRFGKAGLDADRARVGEQQLVVVDEIPFAAFAVRDGGAPCAADLAKSLHRDKI